MLSGGTVLGVHGVTAPHHSHVELDIRARILCSLTAARYRIHEAAKTYTFFSICVTLWRVAVHGVATRYRVILFQSPLDRIQVYSAVAQLCDHPSSECVQRAWH